jgi:Dolichyl-phosphate-mannose-protein mannosyltransferase
MKTGAKKIADPLWILLIPIVGVLIFTVFRFNLLDMPFERDEGHYGYVGSLVLDGKIPYQDYFDNKPPGFFYVYAFLEMIFGKTVFGLHLAFLIINIINSYSIYFITKKLIGVKEAAISVIIFNILSINPFLNGFTIQTEFLVVLFGLGSLLLVINATVFWKFILAGMLGGMALMIKQPGIFFIATIGLYILLEKEKTNANKVKNILFYGLGIATIVAGFGLLMVSYGVYDQFMYWLIEFPKNYINTIPLDKGIISFGETFQMMIIGNLLIIIMIALGILGIVLSKIENRKKIFLAAFFIFSFLSITPGLRFYGHYFLLWIPVLAIVGSMTLTLFSKYLGDKKGTIAALSLLTIGLLIHFNSYKNYYSNSSPAMLLRDVYQANPFYETKVLSDFIATKAQPNDQLMVLGTEAQMNFYTGLKSPTRHVSMLFLGKKMAKATEWQKETIKAVEDAKPRFIVQVNMPNSWMFKSDSDQSILEWAFPYLQDHYRPIAIADMINTGYTKYLYDNEAASYTTDNKLFVKVFERTN